MGERVTSQTVLWYIPNQIGYLRVATAVVSLFSMREHPVFTSCVYGVSCLLDAVDGTMARKYNQVSRVGAVLDMVTDRCATASLTCFLAVVYPQWCVVFQLLISLDLASHYMHMYASLSAGSESHKQVSRDSSRLLHWYYTRRDVLFTVCAFNEVFYMGLYLYGFERFARVGAVLVAVCVPGYLFKQVANVVQLRRAAVILATVDARDASERLKRM
ncbi:hypothetical protein HG536_0G01600 [Torulaspora globosa]|uniref:CDP-diacylglycerol--inositol 3-phosphatidyltransferase n=1 Tax=Torulaspora globosa TaxID=48254 RepID=A0A7G3ZLB5_9SACH|nr:uncharacterized protein HG536_0G01600 [Torulaspora globosa]QLL34301.1 hypothetical protein HG536_0G01600 [Torulaspora globosa]